MLGAASEAVSLFMAILPVYWGRDLEQAPHIALLFYNDCRYIAAHVAALHAHVE